MSSFKKVGIAFVILLTAACTSLGEDIYIHDSDNRANIDYGQLVSSIQSSPALSEITRLRQATVITGRHKDNAANEQLLNQALFEAIEAFDWTTCLHNANKALNLNYAGLNSHYGAMACSLELGDTEQSHYHESVFNLLLEAIWQTGDGESIDTAFHILNRTDRNAFIEFHGLELLKQNIAHRDGRDYTITTVYDAVKDDVFEWYFTPLK